MVERCFNQCKGCRRIATRHDRLARDYLGEMELVGLLAWLPNPSDTPYRLAHPSPRRSCRPGAGRDSGGAAVRFFPPVTGAPPLSACWFDPERTSGDGLSAPIQGS
ncbi:Transposase DDE domain [Streptoalloteichus tenebrarius]|uniref:Transposase DDE domain n=1 Tax=Streptoalloteichus tenebrarius (strain ATCC 17920 / DSM 40477 / JCM 4838 / CBS 697.72 / NBRC 16177 / NCIMB 11028 / NRRL B-12390 / A12253. 1 / ISP 5477) TaxID=1933 RepID=A0ABT1I321_STRSD|nr:Transposase DDE domain [Streptoalloteichus tenebrarius]BFE98973.1 hypothetical protein GCM10020241_06490 [Streptoalloteichus tenebrarius]